MSGAQGQGRPGRTADALPGPDGRRPRAAAHGLYLQTFGGFCLYRAGRPAPAGVWRRSAAKLVLVRLLLAEGRPVAKAELCADLWPDAPEGAAGNRLRVCLHALRRALQPGLPPHLPSAFLAAGRGSCALSPHPDLQWDAGLLLRALPAASAAADRASALAALRIGLAGLRGPWLPEIDGGAGLAAARWHLTSTAADAALRLGDLALDAGDPTLARSAGEQALSIDPASEQAYGLLLRAAGLQGSPVLVRRTYEFASAELRRNLDAEPGPWLQRVAREAMGAAARGGPALRGGAATRRAL